MCVQIVRNKDDDDNVCMFTVSNALLMSNATAMVRVGGMGWLKPVATVLLMLCSAVFVECLVVEPVLCCDVLVCSVLCKEESPSRVFLRLQIEGISACMTSQC